MSIMSARRRRPTYEVTAPADVAAGSELMVTLPHGGQTVIVLVPEGCAGSQFEIEVDEAEPDMNEVLDSAREDVT